MKVPLRIFSVLWAKKTDEDRDARPLCLPQHFSISKTLWNTEWFLYEMFRYWETNIFEAQSWSPDLFFLQHFLHLESYLKHRRVSWRTLLVLWNKIVLRRIVIPLPFFARKISMLDFSEARKCSPTKCFSTVRQKNWRRIVMPTPFLIQKTLFDLKKFLKHNRVPLRNFSVLWDFSGEKKFQRSIMIHLAHLCTKNFDMKNFVKHKSVPLWNASVLWAKNTDEDPDAHPLSCS